MKKLPADEGIKIFDIRWNTITAGPSPYNNERTELFLLGCKKAAQGNPCKGCFNSSLWDSSKAEFSWDPLEVAKKINELAPNKYISIGGGEPTDQLYYLITLCKELKEYGFHILLYTYQDFKKIKETVEEVENREKQELTQFYTNGKRITIDYNEASRLAISKEIQLMKLFDLVDIIIDGEYDVNENLYDSFVCDGFFNSIGSGNQRIWDTKSRKFKYMRDLKGIKLDENNNLIYIE